MSRAERRQTTNSEPDIDAVLKEYSATTEQTRSNIGEDIVSEVPFRPVSFDEVVSFTHKVRVHQSL